MIKLLRKDLSLRVLSVLLAIFLWFIVSNSVNPIKQTTLTVPLTIINTSSLQDKGIVITDEKFTKNVLVTVEARENLINDLTSNDFQVNLDFSKINSVSDNEITVDPPVYIGNENKNNIKIIDIKPTKIKLSLEKQGKNSFKVEIIPTGQPKKGYQVVNTSTDPDNVIIEGLDSQINSVGSIKAFVDVSNINKDTVMKKDCKVYDRNGNEIPALSKDLAVNVKIQVAKEVPLIADVKGMPADNYSSGAANTNPQTVLITGAPEILDKIDFIKTETVNINNSTKNIDVMKKIKLPDGVKLYSAANEVEVTIPIEQLASKSFSIPSDGITLVNMVNDSTLNYSIQAQSIDITLKGDRLYLDSIDLPSLAPTIDVGGLEEGVYKLPLKVVLPSTVNLAQNYLVEVKVDKR
ncbi:MAG: CdaR family protein [Bacillota bacterium]|nr:CdaR family protein [Bacillota bacterium]